MKRPLLLLLALPALALVTLAPLVVRAENENWNDLRREFKSKFKTKNPLSERRDAVSSVAKGRDGRGVKELLKIINKQQKHAEDLRDEWEKEEAAWQEKTDKLNEQVNRKREQANGGSISVTEEEDEWLGLTEKYQQPNGPKPKIMTEKARIMGLYEAVLAEEDFTGYIFQSVARLINSLEGEELEDAVEDAANAARRARGDDTVHYIRMLAYVKGEDATDALLKFADDTDIAVSIAALQALGRQNSERGMQALIERLEDPRWQVRSAVLKGLSFFHDPRVMDALIAAAKKEDGVLRRKYFAAMARIVDEKVPGTIEAWESFWEANREDLIAAWEIYPKGEPVLGDPPDIPIDTSLGSTSFYGIQTDSKHIIFVVDVSGSMSPESAGVNEQGKSRIEVARDELKRAIQTLSASDEDERGEASFNIVIYSDEPRVYKEGKMVTATVKNKEKAFEWIDENVQATGMTNIYDAVEQAFNIISDSSDKKNLKKGADTIFVMTDGFPNRGKFFDAANPAGDQEVMLREIRKLNEIRKITIHAIGIGQGVNQIFLNKLAAQNDGQFLGR